MNSYFKGWYFKLENKNHTIAIIPSTHTDKNGATFASIQVISHKGAWSEVFSEKDYFSCKKNLPVKIGSNIFSEHGIKININTDKLTVFGSVIFGSLSPIKYDIMGPFSLVPFMECRHSILSMTHTLKGSLTINGEEYNFDNGVGYIEGDRGTSFPKEYAWTQCNFYDEAPCSICLSVAQIPLGLVHFTGVIGVIFWQGKEYRIATYLGARATRISGGEITVKQGSFTLTAKLIEKKEHLLQAPICGDMARFIRESPSCTALYRFEENEKTLFEFKATQAAFEYEYSD